MNRGCESRLWDVVAGEGLVDFSEYHEVGFFDEFPIYSRSKQVSFLAELGKDRADSALLEFALKFLRSIIWYDVGHEEFFAAVTVWDNPDDRYVVPRLFICSGKLAETINGNIVLEEPKAASSKRIKKLASRAMAGAQLEVYEDRTTLTNTPRVFLGYAEAALPPNVVPVRSFVRQTTAAG